MTGRSAEIDILGADGLNDRVYVNPYTGEVLSSLSDAGAAGSPAMYVVRKLHSLEYVGWLGNRLIEMAAGWMVLLVASGIYLWWPRGRGLGTTSIKARRGRPCRSPRPPIARPGSSRSSRCRCRRGRKALA